MAIHLVQLRADVCKKEDFTRIFFNLSVPPPILRQKDWKRRFLEIWHHFSLDGAGRRKSNQGSSILSTGGGARALKSSHVAPLLSRICTFSDVKINPSVTFICLMEKAVENLSSYYFKVLRNLILPRSISDTTLYCFLSKDKITFT